MRLSKLVSVINQTRVPVEGLAALILFSSSISNAATGPSWSSQPAWSTDSSIDSNAGITRRTSKRQVDPNLRPYSPGSNNVALDVGQVFLMGDTGAKYQDSIGEQVHYTYGVSELFGFDSSLGYSSHSDGKFSMVTALTGLRANLSYYDKVIPYGIIGLGFYKPTYTITGSNSLDTTASSVLFGLHVGGGVDLELTRALFFGAALTLHDVFGTTQQVQGGQLAMGGTFASFLIHAGVTF